MKKSFSHPCLNLLTYLESCDYPENRNEIVPISIDISDIIYTP